MKLIQLPRFVRVCAIALTSLGGLTALVGCDKGTTATPSTPAAAAANVTGVVDLDKVADAVGWKSEINKDNETAKAELTRQLTAFIKEVTDKVSQHKADLIKSANLNTAQADDLNKGINIDKLPLTKEQVSTLVLIVQNGNQYIQGADQRAGQMLQGRGFEILNSYRKATQPIVRQVAEQNGMSVVLVKTDAIFHSASSVDITDKVIDAVRANPPKITYPGMPDMKLPPVNLGELPKPTTQPSSVSSTTKPK